MQLPPGLSLLLETLRTRLASQNATPTASSDIDVVQSAIEIGAANKLLVIASRGLDPLLTAEQRAIVSQYKMRTVARNSAIMKESVRIFRHLDRRNIATIVIKGPLQQQVLYDDYFMRPSGDIDLLVSTSSYSATLTALQELDYSVGSKSVWWRAFLGEQHLVRSGPPAPTIDLHYRLQQPGSPAPKSTTRYLAAPGLSRVLDTDLPRLADQDIPILSAISIVKALFNREAAGGHVCDLFASIRADVPKTVNSLLTHAREQRILGTALLALRIVSETFGVEFDPRAETSSTLPGVAGEQLVRMSFVPDDPDLVWPKRRTVLWELCRHDPLLFTKEAARALASEATLRLFERPEQATRPTV